MCNQDIRLYAEENGVKLWKIAMVLGIHDSNFSRKLRCELTANEKQKIVKIIDELVEECD